MVLGDTVGMISFIASSALQTVAAYCGLLFVTAKLARSIAQTFLIKHNLLTLPMLRLLSSKAQRHKDF